MYHIVYRFGKKIFEYVAFTEQDRDSFLDTLKSCGIRILAVRYRLC